jgi:uncharacterized protein (TIGR03435 family)
VNDVFAERCSLMELSPVRASRREAQVVVHTRTEGTFVGVAFALVGCVMSIAGAHGQGQRTDAAVDPAFEVVSVKADGVSYTPASPGARVYSRTVPFRYTPQSLSAIQTMKAIIQEAYGVEDWAVIPSKGSAEWMSLLAYSIDARMPPGTSRESARLMLRTMLAERFGLKLHFEKRDIPVYVVVEGSKGFKLREASGKLAPYGTISRGQFNATGTLDNIATYSRAYADRPVINMAGREGVYHIEVRWTPDLDSSGSRDDPEFWAALEREAGLKRDSRKVPRDVIVVDHVEHTPTAN